MLNTEEKNILYDKLVVVFSKTSKCLNNKERDYIRNIILYREESDENHKAMNNFAQAKFNQLNK